MSLNWLFTSEQLANLTPSRISGISFEEELEQRSIGISLIRECGISLQLLVKFHIFTIRGINNNKHREIEVIGVAMVLFHRFYCAKSLKDTKLSVRN